MDVLGGLDEIKICVGYKMGDVEINEMPASAIALENCEPVYVTMPGFPSHSLEEWLGIARKCNSEGIGFSGLPAAAQNYITKLESILGVTISSVGLGPDRDATVDRGESSKEKPTRWEQGALGSAGRALGLQPSGRGFKSHSVHHQQRRLAR